jgi:hypothetical protein
VRPGFVLALALVASPALACSVASLTIEETARRADAVVHGVVASVRVEAGERGLPVTVVSIARREVVKGDPRLERLVLRLPGGSREGVTVVVHGVPTFREGEEVVVAATPPHPRSGLRVPVGLCQGKWTVEEHGGRRIARRDLGDAHVVGGGPGETSLELGELLRRLGERPGS